MFFDNVIGGSGIMDFSNLPKLVPDKCYKCGDLTLGTVWNAKTNQVLHLCENCYDLKPVGPGSFSNDLSFPLKLIKTN